MLNNIFTKGSLSGSLSLSWNSSTRNFYILKGLEGLAITTHFYMNHCELNF